MSGQITLFAALFLLLAAPFVGSFLALVACRLPAGQTIVFGRSRCSSCARTLSLGDLFPIASWLMTGRRCRGCKTPISAFYPFVEFAALVVAVWSLAALPLDLVPLGCLLGWCLLLLAVIDSRTLTLPDELTLPLIAAGLLATWAMTPDRLFDHVLGAALGGAALWLIAALYYRMRGREGLGLGDAKLLAAAGAWLGWQGLGSVILIAAVSALVLILGRSAMGHRLSSEDPLPFGPFLALGIWVTWLYGPLGPAIAG